MSRALPVVPGVDVAHRFVTARGLRFHVAEAGPPDGPPLVLLHGWPQHWYLWRKVLGPLSARYRCVMPDLRGFGWSDAPAQGYEKDELACDVLAVLDALGLGRVRLLAHDWGAWVGFLIALREPERIERCVALGIPPPWSGGTRDPRGALELWRVWYQLVLASPWGPRIVAAPRFLPRALRADNVHAETFSDADVEAFAAALREPARARASRELYRSFLVRDAPALRHRPFDQVRLRVPTLLLVGSADPVVTPAVVRAAARPGDALTVEIVEGSGHFIAEELPELVAARTLDWFAASR